MPASLAHARSFRRDRRDSPWLDVRALLELMAGQHGIATTAQARALGVSRRVEVGLVERGLLAEPLPGVLAAAGVAMTFERRAMAAALGPGTMAVAHGAAARLHGLDGFEDHDVVDLIGVNGAAPHPSLRAGFHQTRGPVGDHVVEVHGIPVLSIPLTLTLLAPVAGIGKTARALDAALRRGTGLEELHEVAHSWRRRGRSGPPALLMLIAERTRTPNRPVGPAEGGRSVSAERSRASRPRRSTGRRRV
jgi:hypothetical protein